MRPRRAFHEELPVTVFGMAHVTKGPHLGEGIIGESRTLHTDSLACVDHGLELVVRSLRNLTTCIHDEDARTDLLDFLHVVARVDDGRSLVVQAQDSVEDGVPALRINGNRGLVQEDELGPVGDATGDVETAQQTARELLGTEALEFL